MSQGLPQLMSIALGGTIYNLSLLYRNDQNAGWTLDISDANNNPILQGIPLVTGADLLAQYGYLGFAGGLWVQTTSDPDAVPTFDNFGADAQLYWVQPQ